VSYCYRLRFRSASGLTSQEKSAILTIPSFTRPLSVKTSDVDLSSAKWFSIETCGYDSEIQAKIEGQHLAEVLTLAGVIGRLGIDVGVHSAGLSFGAEFRQAFLQQFGRELRGEVHGVDVFKEGSVSIIGSQIGGHSHSSKERWEALIGEASRLVLKLTGRQSICARLINDSFFVPSFDVQFILRISAVEALCTQEKLDKNFQDMADALLGPLEKLDGDERNKKILRDAIDRARVETIAKAYRAKIEPLLGPEKRKQFDKLYRTRGKFLHRGKERGSLATAASETLEIASDLLIAELRASSLC
jgi:hypothetical protein